MFAKFISYTQQQRMFMFNVSAFIDYWRLSCNTILLEAMKYKNNSIHVHKKDAY